jgi:hypothetical protein
MDTTVPSTEPTVHEISEFRFDELLTKVEKFSRRAAKLGQAPVTLEVVGEKTRPVLNPETGKPTGAVRVNKLVVVHGKAPVVAGHTFIAKVEHTEAGNIMGKAPGCEGVAVPTEMRDGKPVCDHCKTNRQRKDTFILRRDEDGSLIRVGRNCLADYLRTEDAAEALRLWALLREIQSAAGSQDEEGSWGGSSYCYPGIVTFVACVIRAITLNGWTSRKEAYEQDKQSTASQADFACGPCPSREESRKDWQEAQPTEDNVVEAAKAIEWAKTLAGDSDYEHNLKVACSLDYVKGKNFGLVASVVVAYRRFVEKELAKTREVSAPSTHFGKVGRRYVRKLTVTNTSSWDSDYGVTVLYVMADAEGNVFKWFSSGGCRVNDVSVKVGDEFWATFAVKGHGDFKGRKETTVTRASLSVEKPEPKWVNEVGEVFKSRKEMQAA